MIVYLAQDIPTFVMYCVNGASRSSLLIESTNSMIMIIIITIIIIIIIIIIIVIIIKPALFHSSTRVTKSKLYNSRVRDHVIAHLGLNVNSSAHNCGCVVDGSNTMATI